MYVLYKIGVHVTRLGVGHQPVILLLLLEIVSSYEDIGSRNERFDCVLEYDGNGRYFLGDARMAREEL